MGPVKTTRADLISFTDKLNHSVSGLKHTSQFDATSIITSLCVSSLAKPLQVDWELRTQSSKQVPPVEDLIEFVRDRADALAGQPVQATTKSEPKAEPPKRNKAVVHTTQPLIGFKYDCALCSDKHPLYLCSRFNSMTLDQRGEHIRSHKLCYNCLAPGHRTNDCRNPRRVPVVIIMMTSQVVLEGPKGQRMVVRALLDSGASMSLVSARAAQRLQLPRTQTHITFSGVQGTPAKPTNSLVTIAVSANQPTLQISAAVVQKVTCDLPLQGATGVQDLPHIRTLPLADPTFDKPGRVDLLLGCDIWSSIMLPESRPGTGKNPSAWKTIFGWAIFGQYIPGGIPSNTITSVINHTLVVETADTLLYRFWETEEPPSLKNALTPEEVEVQQHFITTHRFLSHSGRYQVTLPRRPGMPPLEDSKQQTLQHYQANEQAIIRKGNWPAFQAVVQEYLDLGHAQPVPTNELHTSNEKYLSPNAWGSKS